MDGLITLTPRRFATSLLEFRIVRRDFKLYLKFDREKIKITNNIKVL